MSTYQKTTWNTGDTITAEKLNKAENEIAFLSKMQFDATSKIAVGGQYVVMTLNTEYDAIVIVTSKESASTLLGLYHYDATNGGGFTVIHKGENISVNNISTLPNNYAGYTVALSGSATAPAYITIIQLASDR